MTYSTTPPPIGEKFKYKVPYKMQQNEAVIVGKTYDKLHWVVQDITTDELHYMTCPQDWNIEYPIKESISERVPDIGDYCFVSRWSDGDLHDPWSVGQLVETKEKGNRLYYRVEGQGCLDRFFPNCKVITEEEGLQIISSARKLQEQYN